MKKVLAALLASIILVTGIFVTVYANDIVLPDDEFEEEETFTTGDVNGDGSVNLNDYTLLSRIISGASVIPGGDADVDGNGSITLNDYTRLSRITSGANI